MAPDWIAPSTAQATSGLDRNFAHGGCQVGADLVVALGAQVGLDAAGRDDDGLGGGAHLARVERERERQVGQHGLVVVGRLDHDVVDAGELGVDLGLLAVVDQPLAEDVAAGEVDRLDRRMGDQGLGRGTALGHAQRDQVQVDAVLGQHGADGAHGDGGRQDRVAVRLDDDGVAGRERGEQARIGVPGREGAAADHQADATADDLVMLLHHQRRVLALGLFPVRLGRHEALLAPGVGDRLQAAVQRVGGGAGLEGHHPALAGGGHHGMAHLEALLVDSVQDLEADAGAARSADGLPALHRGLTGGNQRLDVADRIAHVERDAVGRAFLAAPAALAGLAELEVPAQVGLERGLAVGSRGLTVDLGLGISLKGDQ